MSLTSYRAAPPRVEVMSARMRCVVCLLVGRRVNGFFWVRGLQCLATTYSSIA